MKNLDTYIEAWYLRTLPAIDLDNGGVEIAPPTQEEWKQSVKEDLEMLLNSKKKIPLTPKQKDIYEYIKKSIEEVNICPSLREIAKRFNLKSVSGVHQHIELLIKKGYLNRNKHQPRELIINSK